MDNMKDNTITFITSMSGIIDVIQDIQFNDDSDNSDNNIYNRLRELYIVRRFFRKYSIDYDNIKPRMRAFTIG
jgi:hypothetical protein